MQISIAFFTRDQCFLIDFVFTGTQVPVGGVPKIPAMILSQNNLHLSDHWHNGIVKLITRATGTINIDFECDLRKRR